VSEVRLNTTSEVHRLAFHTCLFPRLPYTVLQFGAAFSSPAYFDHALLTVSDAAITRIWVLGCAVTVNWANDHAKLISRTKVTLRIDSLAGQRERARRRAKWASVSVESVE